MPQAVLELDYDVCPKCDQDISHLMVPKCHVSRCKGRMDEVIDLNKIIRMILLTSNPSKFAPEPHHFNSRVECSFRDFLSGLGFDVVHPYTVDGRRTDGYLPGINMVIEVDGCYWHGCKDCGFDNPSKQEADRQKDEHYSNHGYRVLRIWEHDVLKLLA